MFKKLVAFVFGFLGMEASEKKLELSADDKQKLDKVTGKDGFAEKFMEHYNASLDENANANQLKEIDAELEQFMSDEGIEMSGKEGEETPSTIDKVKKLTAQNKELTKVNAKLEDEEEKDKTIAIVGAGNVGKSVAMKIVHSKTHLFGSANAYDQFTDRPWNQRAAGLIKAATDFDSIDFTKINQDLGDYYRENKDEVIDMLADYRSLPAHWGVISNISDEFTYAAVLTGDITQARKKAWLPKNKQKFVPMKGKIYPAQIDIEFTGSELQSIETSWMNKFNKEGSSPYKDSFVAYLLAKLLKKARMEDQIALIKGVFMPTADDATVAGSFINRMNGLLKIVALNKNVTYRPFDMGLPTLTNIVDYVKGFGARLPEDVKNTPGLYLYASKTWVRNYLERKKQLDGLMPSYKPEDLKIEGYENINFMGLDYFEGTDLFILTTEDNISILENVPGEKSLLRLDKLKRDIFVYADYKLGAHVHVFGAKWDDNDPVEYSNQLFWSNDVDILTDTFISVPANDTTPSVEYHNAIQVGINTGATAITAIDDVVDGQYVYIKGNGTVNPSTITSGANFDLESDITLSDGVVLVLYKRADKLTEIERFNVTADSEVKVVLAADAITADATDGDVFITSANTTATAITNIDNAVKDEVYTIEGGSDTNATTIAKTGVFSRITATVTLTTGKFIKVRFNGTSFVELERN